MCDVGVGVMEVMEKECIHEYNAHTHMDMHIHTPTCTAGLCMSGKGFREDVCSEEAG